MQHAIHCNFANSISKIHPTDQWTIFWTIQKISLHLLNIGKILTRFSAIKFHFSNAFACMQKHKKAVCGKSLWLSRKNHMWCTLQCKASSIMASVTIFLLALNSFPACIEFLIFATNFWDHCCHICTNSLQRLNQHWAFSKNHAKAVRQKQFDRNIATWKTVLVSVPMDANDAMQLHCQMNSWCSLFQLVFHSHAHCGKLTKAANWERKCGTKFQNRKMANVFQIPTQFKNNHSMNFSSIAERKQKSIACRSLQKPKLFPTQGSETKALCCQRVDFHFVLIFSFVATGYATVAMTSFEPSSEIWKLSFVAFGALFGIEQTFGTFSKCRSGQEFPVFWSSQWSLCACAKVQLKGQCFQVSAWMAEIENCILAWPCCNSSCQAALVLEFFKLGLAWWKIPSVDFSLCNFGCWDCEHLQMPHLWMNSSMHCQLWQWTFVGTVTIQNVLFLWWHWNCWALMVGWWKKAKWLHCTVNDRETGQKWSRACTCQISFLSSWFWIVIWNEVWFHFMQNLILVNHVSPWIQDCTLTWILDFGFLSHLSHSAVRAFQMCLFQSRIQSFGFQKALFSFQIWQQFHSENQTVHRLESGF